MKIEDQVRFILTKYFVKYKMDLWSRNKIAGELTRLIKNKEDAARQLGYEQGRMDRPSSMGRE